MGNAIDGHYREAFNFIVVTGVIAKWPFIGFFAGMQMAFEDKFCGGGNLQITAKAFGDLSFLTAQKSGKGIFR